MRFGLAGGAIAVIVLIVAILGYSTLFTVSQTQQALVVRLGKPVSVITEPGLNWKVPFIDSVIYVDKRILNIESPAQEVIASSTDNTNSGIGTDQAGERLVVDAFARYRDHRSAQILSDRRPLGRRCATRDPAQLGAAARARRRHADRRGARQARGADGEDARPDDRDAKPYGIEVVDVRIRRADLPEKNSQAVYQRMQTERQREAAEFRAQGSQKSQEIRARADRDVTVLLADATSSAEQIRGQGDSERNRIFADAYTRDPDFFTFYRSMQAYDKSMQRGDTRLVLKPDSDFFRYFSDPLGRQQPQPGTAPNPPASTSSTPPSAK